MFTDPRYAPDGVNSRIVCWVELSTETSRFAGARRSSRASTARAGRRAGPGFRPLDGRGGMGAPTGRARARRGGAQRAHGRLGWGLGVRLNNLEHGEGTVNQSNAFSPHFPLAGKAARGRL